jgi:hypothetical protein
MLQFTLVVEEPNLGGHGTPIFGGVHFAQ